MKKDESNCSRNEMPALSGQADPARNPDCQIVQDLLPLYAENLVSPASRQFVESHLPSCPDCRALLETIRDPKPALDPPSDKAAEHALRKVHRKFGFLHFALICLGILLLIFAVFLGSVFRKHLILPAQELYAVTVPQVTDQDLTICLESMYGKLFLTSVQEKEDGVYEISGSSWKQGQKTPYSNTFSLERPVREVSFNGSVIYQDGTVISPRCSSTYTSYANGYAGDVLQMKLGMPSLSGFSFHTKADTDNPQECVWSYVQNSEGTASPDLSELDDATKTTLQANALLALALTPNLAEIRYCRPDGQVWMNVTRSELNSRLAEQNISPAIHSMADLQKIMNVILPAAG